MKKCLIFFLFSLPIFSELSKNDIEEIRKIVREEVQREVGALRQEMNLKFEAQEQRFEAIDQRFEAVDQRFEALDQRFEEIDKRFHLLYILLSSIIGFMGIMVGSVLWLAKQERPMSMKHYKEITKREEYLEKEIFELKEAIEELKPVVA
ncbi:MAG: hypothetical protein AB1630_01915 [bacterium]